MRPEGKSLSEHAARPRGPRRDREGAARPVRRGDLRRVRSARPALHGGRRARSSRTPAATARSRGATIAGLYVVGGGGLFPLVTRVLKERFGEKRVRRSPLSLRRDRDGPRRLPRPRGRLGARGHAFATLRRLPRERRRARTSSSTRSSRRGRRSRRPVRPPTSVARRYRAAHNVGHFRFLECTRLTAGRPDGDVTPWDEVFFPFEPPRETAALARRRT